MTQIDVAVKIYTSAVQSGSSSRLIKNLQWLLRLRSRASEAMARPRDPTDVSADEGGPQDPGEVELLGWRTRLIQRATSSTSHVATTIMDDTGMPAEAVSPQTAMENTLFQALQQHLADSAQAGQAPQPLPAPVDGLPGVSQETSTDTLVSFHPDSGAQLKPVTPFLGPYDVAGFPRRWQQCFGMFPRAGRTTLRS